MLGRSGSMDSSTDDALLKDYQDAIERENDLRQELLNIIFWSIFIIIFNLLTF